MKKAKLNKIIALSLSITIAMSSFVYGSTNDSETFVFEMDQPSNIVIEETDSEDDTIERVSDVETDIIEGVSDTIASEELEMLALVTMAEAGNQSELGKRLVIDTVLNRVDHENFPDSIVDTIMAPNQYSSVWDGGVDKCYVDDDIYQLVLDELENRTNTEVLFFRTDYYHNFGSPMFKVEDHYFSKY